MSHATQAKRDCNSPLCEHTTPDTLGWASDAAQTAASGAPGANEEPESGPGRESFFRVLNWDRHPTGRDGQPWIVAHQSMGAVAALAKTDRILAGLDAVLAVMRAADYARTEGLSPHDGLSDFLADELSLAARELSRAASESLSLFRELAER